MPVIFSCVRSHRYDSARISPRPCFLCENDQRRYDLDECYCHGARIHPGAFLNLLGVPTLVLEMGQGHDIHRSFGNQIVDGIFHIMSEMDIWEGPEPVVQEPAVSSDGEVEFIRSAVDGVFLPLIEHNHYVKKGDLIGEVVDLFEGTVKQQIRTERGGLLFTLRAYPVVYEGDLLARILTE